MNDRILRIAISKSNTIWSALKKMDEVNAKLLLLLSDNGHFEGLVTIGDIQRAIIANISLDNTIDTIIRKNIHYALSTDAIDKIKEEMLRQKDECMPIINEKGVLVDAIFWDDLFSETKKLMELQGVPVIIMAGGKGIRMRPLTNVIPKPLIPIGEKTIAEHIMDRFLVHGCSEFIFSVNYKADLIKYYFKQLEKSYCIKYIQEDKPLGTAGSLSLLRDYLKSSFFITNCDILLTQDYSEIYNFHVTNCNSLTVVSSIQSHYIPYGTLETGENGELITMIEKPDLTYKINTGFYVCEPTIIDIIENHQEIDFPTLIRKAQDNNFRIGVFPVSEKQYTDLGNLQMYLSAINIIK